ncbi:MAG: type II secretion system F family protein [Bacilli bacterium]|nr:type II secretion system F family protein [Bacilli bacterium]
MEASIVVLLSIQIILILLAAFILTIILDSHKMLHLENRISNYSLTIASPKDISTFDKFYILLWKFIKKISKINSHSELIKKYSLKYDKYIDYNEKNDKTGIDLVSIKFLISIIMGLIYIISTFIRLNFNLPILLFIMILSFFIVDIYYKLEYKSRCKQIEEDLLGAIILMNNAFKSGMNIIEALSIVEKETSGPIQKEFKKINKDIKYGLSLETTFNRFYERVKIEDAKYLTSSLSLINKTGGNIVKVFNSIEKNFYDKKRINDEMKSLISSSIFMYRMLVIMPIILSLIITAINLEYFKPLIFTTLGRLILLAIIVLYIIYIIVIKKVIKVDM